MKGLKPLFYYFLTAALDVFPPPLAAEEAFELEFFADGLTDLGAAVEVKAFATGLADFSAASVCSEKSNRSLA